MSTNNKMGFFLSIGLLLVFGWHFGTVFGLVGTAPQTQSEFFMRIGIILAAFFATSVVTTMLVEKMDENTVVPDEREEKIYLKSEFVGGFVLYVGLLILMWFVFLPMTPMQVANAILGVVCITEISKLIVGLYYLNNRL